jgi:catechol 2,3-dioxygenase-like lactoylglutathione lyase family enzyme
MISGAHVILYSKDAEADRAFFRDVLEFPSVDAGHGWLIFALPPAEAAFHPADGNERHELYFMCDDLKAEISELAKKGVHHQDPPARRRGAGSLSAEASNGVGAGVRLTRQPPAAARPVRRSSYVPMGKNGADIRRCWRVSCGARTPACLDKRLISTLLLPFTRAEGGP